MWRARDWTKRMTSPSGRSILELMRMKRRTAEMAGPAGKRRKVDKKDTDININRLFLEVAAGMCMGLYMKRMENIPHNARRQDQGLHH